MTSTSLTGALRETLTLFERGGVPKTTSEVADALDLGRRSAYERLERLVDHDRLDTKKVGSNGRVWWRPSTPADMPAGSAATAESLIDDVLERAEIGIVVLDADFDVVWINQATERYFGLDREELLGRSKRRLVESDIAAVLDEGPAVTEAVLKTDDDNTSTERFECRVTVDDEDPRWLEYRSKPIESGAYAGGRIELYDDVTDRKETKQAHGRNRKQFESIIDAVEEYAILMLDRDGFVTTWNQGAERINGYAAEEIIGEHVSTLYTEQAREEGIPQQHLAGAMETGSIDTSGWETRADGSQFWANGSITAIRNEDGAVDGFVLVTRDMTEHRSHKQEIQRERDVLEQVQEISPIGIGIFDTTGELVRANQRFAELLGKGESKSVDYSLGDQPALDADGNVIPYHERPAPRALATGESVTDQRLRIDAPDGQTRWLSVNAKPFEGEADGVVVTTADITQLKQQSQRLERQRDRLHDELEGVYGRIDEAFFAVDEDWRFTHVTDRAAELVEVSAGELLGAVAWDVLPGSPEQYLRGEAERAMESQEPFETEFYSPFLDVWVEVRGYPSATGLSVYVRNVSERKEHELALEQYERIVETVADGIYVLDESTAFQRVNDALTRMTDFDREELLGSHASRIFGAQFDELDAEANAQFSTGETDVAAFEEEIYTADGEAITVQSRFRQFEVDDGQGRVGVLRDVTDRKRYENRLQELIDVGEELLGADKAQAISEILVQTASDVLDLPVSVVYRYDGDRTLLVPEASALEPDSLGEQFHPVAPDDESLTAKVYRAGEPRYDDDVTESTGVEGLSDDCRMRTGLFVPLGEEGVIVVGSRDVDGIDASTRQLVELLARNAVTAYDRVGRQAELRRRRAQLQALNSLNDVVREITSAVIDQSTREEIETTVCERLADSESYRFAWIGDVDRSTQTVKLHAEAGVERYLDEITISVDPDDERSGGATGRALQREEIQISHDIRADARYDPWREYVEQHGIRSSAAIPIVHDETVYGVINVYADRPFAFDGPERAVIDQLGDVVGHAIAAAERKQALMSDELVELEFQIQDVFTAIDVPVETSGRITLDNAVPIGDGEFLVYGTATPDAIDAVRKITETLSHWQDLTIRSTGDPTNFELKMTDPPVLSTVASIGGYVEQAVFEDGVHQMRIHLAPSVDARRIIETVEAAYPTAEMLRRRQISRIHDGSAGMQRHFLDDLTDRQRTALETAYHAGFFEWPRDATGEAVATSIGVAAPTFHQHLRKAERKVFDSVFSSTTSSVVE